MIFKRLLIPLSFIAVVFLIFWALQGAETIAFEFPENKIWAHRQNSQEQAEKSLAHGIGGVEMDVWYFDDRFILSHDEPKDKNANTLEPSLKAIAGGDKKPYIWLDIKNLKFSNELAIKKRLTELMETYHLEKSLFVESKKPWSMLRLCQEKIKCSLWMYQVDSSVKMLWIKLSARILVNFSNIIAISMDYRDFDKLNQQIPKGWPRLLFTFSKKVPYLDYLENPQIKVLLISQ